MTCLCTGQWEFAVLCVFGCGFDLFVYWPMGARGWVRVQREKEEKRRESRERVGGEDGENGRCAASPVSESARGR